MKVGAADSPNTVHSAAADDSGVRDLISDMPHTENKSIELEGVRVHNLKNVDLSLPLNRLTVISGVSGSGKSSLAFDTLYAEGQRRYIECFSAYARQFLDRLEKPDAERIDNIPPAIAIRQSSVRLNSKSTVATTTEIHDYLRLLFAKVGRIVCPDCRVEVSAETPEDALHRIHRFRDGTRFQICFPLDAADEGDRVPGETGEHSLMLQLHEDGFGRVIIGGKTVRLAECRHSAIDTASEIWVVVDRLTADKTPDDRIVDSLETAFQHGDQRCLILEQTDEPAGSQRKKQKRNQTETAQIDGKNWHVHRLSGRLECPGCSRTFAAPEPRLFSFSAPLGACPECRGFGSVPAISFDRLVPDPSKSLREGAIAAWTTPAYRHELDELLALADDYNLPVDVPFSELNEQHRQLIIDGVQERPAECRRGKPPFRRFGGLKGFFRWLERHKYKLGVLVFLNRWRSYETCPKCRGARLNPDALAVEVAGHNIAGVCEMTIREAAVYFDDLSQRLDDTQRHLAATVLEEIRTRLGYLTAVGLGYLTLARQMRTLSAGEAQRVSLTSALGSSLVNTLYVLDEPSAGLHPRDSERVIRAIRRLRETGNTVVVVEHEFPFLEAADVLVDVGPGAGRDGGRILYQGPPGGVGDVEESQTGAFLSGRASIHKHPVGDADPQSPAGFSSAQKGERPTKAAGPAGAARHASNTKRSERFRIGTGAKLVLTGARQHNLKNLDVEFPLGVLCVVTGVSGSGKSTLVETTLYPAVCSVLGQTCDVWPRGKFDRLEGADAIDEAVRVDQTPIGRTPRSNPVTYMKAFAEVRRAFAESPEARLRNLTPAAFSFNARDGGRCGKCNGSGVVQIDMQFLADVTMTCPECHGTRYQRNILDVKFRGLSIDEVLNMTVREAFAFFRGWPKIQRRLQLLIDVGLDYLPLGQPATTLSGGESQRLKLASFLSGGKKSARSRQHTLFLIDEPTTGLHAADVARLLTCFESLLAVGHSLIVIEHNLDVIRAADHLIDLGPDAGDAGGEIVACGTPEEICGVESSLTGHFLKSATQAATG